MTSIAPDRVAVLVAVAKSVMPCKIVFMFKCCGRGACCRGGGVALSVGEVLRKGGKFIGGRVPQGLENGYLIITAGSSRCFRRGKQVVKRGGGW